MSSSSGDDDDDAPRVAAASAAAAARVPAKRAKSVDVSGFLHNGVMYLRDRDSDAVYQTERDAKGNLVQLGRWIDGQPLFFAAPKQLDNDDDAEAEAPPALSKRQRKELALAQLVTRVLPPLNFVVTDVADHAETGIKAYRDVKFVLDALAAVTGKPQPEIYDPYFCTGRVKEHLAKVGYTAVYNENEDFYAKIASGLPEYDVVLTNPPYSEDHIDRIVAFCAQQTKPAFLLLPAHVISKPYYASYLAAGNRPIYVVPKTGRFTYNSPQDASQGLHAKRIAPFASFWYIDLKNLRGAVLTELSRARAARVNAKLPDDATYILCPAADAIPSRCLDDSHPRKLKDKEKSRANAWKTNMRQSRGPAAAAAADASDPRGRGASFRRRGAPRRGGSAPPSS